MYIYIYMYISVCLVWRGCHSVSHARLSKSTQLWSTLSQMYWLFLYRTFSENGVSQNHPKSMDDMNWYEYPYWHVIFFLILQHFGLSYGCHTFLCPASTIPNSTSELNVTWGFWCNQGYSLVDFHMEYTLL